MSKASELVAELAAAGELDSAGGFSLDRGRAREKMRQFQLADPRKYVLALVEAAVLKGATTIKFDIDADDVRVTFDGEPFDATDLDELYTSLFVKGDDPALYARRELAVALNAAMALNPRQIRFSSADEGGKGVRATLSTDAQDEIEHEVEGLPPGTNIHVRERFRPGLLVEFVRSLGGARTEHKILRTHCKWSYTPVFVDGDAVSEKLTLSKLHGAVEIKGEGFRGVAGFDLEDSGGARWWPVSNGVLMRRISIIDGPKAFRAYVDATGLRKDVSRSRLAGGPVLDQIRAAVEAAVEPALGKLARALLEQTTQPGRIAPGLPWHSAAAKSQLVHALARFAKNASIEDLDAAHPLRSLLDLEIWPTADGAILSTRALKQSLAHGDERLRYLIDTGRSRGRPKWKPEKWGPLLQLNRFQEAMLRDLFGPSVVTHAKTALERAWKREQARRRWRARKAHARLEPPFAGRVAIERGRIEGEVGVRSSGPSVIRWIVDGSLLGEQPLGLPGLDGVVAVVTGPFKPKADYESVYRDRWFAQALVAVGRAIPVALARALPDSAEQVRRFFVAVSKGDPAMSLLEAHGISHKRAKKRLEQMDGDDASSATPAWKRHIAKSPLFEVPILQTVDGAMVSLSQIASAAESRNGGVWVTFAYTGPIPDAEPCIVVAKQWTKDLLASFFGLRRIVAMDVELEEHLARRRFLERPTVSMDPAPGHGRLDTVVSEPGGRARVGLEMAFGSGVGGTGTANVELLHESRVLVVRERYGPWPNGVIARVESSAIEPDRLYEDVEGELERVDRLVSAGVVQLVEGARERGLQTTGQHRGARDLAMQLLLELVPHRGASDRLWRLAGEGETPAAALGEFVENREDSWEPFAPLVPKLLMWPMFKSCHESRRVLSLWDLHRARRGEARLGWISNPSMWHADDERADQIVCVELQLEVDLLERLFGTDVERADEWMEAYRQEQALLARPRLRDIRLDPSLTVLSSEIRVQGLRGEIAVPKGVARPGAVMSAVTICHEQRPVETLQVDLGVPTLAIVDADHVELNAGGGVQRNAAYRTLETALKRYALALLAKAVDVWEGEGDFARSDLRLWLQWAAIASLRQRDPPLGERLRCLGLWRDIDGEWVSLDEALGPLQELFFVGALPRHEVRPDSLVLLLDAHEQGLLMHSPVVLRNYDQRWAELESGRIQRAHARDLNLRRRPGWSPTQELEAREMAAVFWFPDVNEEPEVWVGSEGKFVQKLDLEPLRLARINANVAVPAGSVTPMFDRAFVGEPQELFKGADALLDEAILQVATPPEMKPHAETEALREALRRATSALARSEDTHLPGQWGHTWLRKLMNVPLYRVQSGHAASLKWLRGARPAEWAGQGLWDERVTAQWLEGYDPNDLVHERTDDRDFSAPPDRRAVRAPAPPRPPEPPQPARGGWWDDEDENDDAPPPPPLLADEVEWEREPSAAELMLDRVRAELRLCRAGNPSLITDAHLDMIFLHHGGGDAPVDWGTRGPCIDLEHPVVKAAIEGGERDRVLDSFVASAVFRALNEGLGNVSDADELAFCHAHALLLSTALADG